MSEVVPLDNLEEIEPKTEEVKKIDFQTKLEFLHQKFYFHESIKQSQKTKHFIVEDIEIDPNMIMNPEDHIFYLKQMIFTDKQEFLNAKEYYQKLLNYCKTPFAKSDIVKLKNFYELELEIVNYFEIVVVCDYGESDRINVAQIQRSHINNFLKNLCVLLQDLKKIQRLYHGNIFLRNIILVNGELKLSGFKPIFSESKEKSWVNEISKKYGNFRLDLYLIGLLWLRFLNYDIDNLIKENLSYKVVSKKIKEITDLWEEEKTFNIVKKLLNLEENEDLELSIVIRDFDEHFILEKINIEVDDSTPNFSGFRNSIESKHSKNPSMNNENPFLKSYNETDITDAKKKKTLGIKNGEDNNIIVDQAFTLQNHESNRNLDLENKKSSLSPEKVKNQFFKKDIIIRGSMDNDKPNDFDRKLKSGSEKQILGEDINVKFSFNANAIPKGIFEEDEFKIIVDKKTFVLKTPDKKEKVPNGKNPNKLQPKNKFEKINKTNNNNKKRFLKKNKPNEKSKSPIKQPTPQKSNPKSKNIYHKPKPLPKKKKTFEKLNKTLKSKFDISNFSKRDKMFSYNSKHNNKNIPFKKVLKKGLNRDPSKKLEELLDNNIQKINKNTTLPLNKDTTINLNNTIEIKQNYYHPSKINNNSLMADASFLDMVNMNDNIEGGEKSEFPDITMKDLKAFESKYRSKLLMGEDYVEEPQELDMAAKIEKYRNEQNEEEEDCEKSIEDDLVSKKSVSKKSNISRKSNITKKSNMSKTNKTIVSNMSQKSKTSRKSSFFAKKTDAEKKSMLSKKSNYIPGQSDQNKSPLNKYLPTKSQLNKSQLSKSQIKKSQMNKSQLNKSQMNKSQMNRSQMNRSTLTKKREAEKIEETPEIELDNIPPYDEGIETLNTYLNEGKPKEATDLLGMMILKYEGVKKIKLYKMISMIFYKQKDYLRAIKFLNKGIDYLENSDVYPKGKISENFLCHLSTCYLESGNHEEALSCLFYKTFRHPENCGFNYYVLLGDCNKACGNVGAARKAYEMPLEYYLNCEMSRENKVKLFMVIDRVFVLFLDFEENEEIVGFYCSLIKRIRGILKVNQSRVGFESFSLIQFLFHLMDLVKQKDNDHFLNYVLNHVKEKKIITFSKLNEEEKQRLSGYYFDFSFYLKNLDNFGGQKKCYLQYLLYSLSIIEKCKVNFQNDRKKLMILFQLGALHLSDLDYKLAKLDFQRCLDIYNRNYEKPQKELFDILFNIGMSVYKLKNYEQAEFYLEELINYDLEDNYMKNYTVKLLVRIYYILKKFKKCKELLKHWFDLDINPKKEDNFFKYFAFYSVCAIKNRSEMEKFLTKMKNEIISLENEKRQHYFTLFYNIFNVYLKKNDSNTNHDLLDEMNLICKTKNAKRKAQRFISLFSFLYCKFILNLKKRSKNNIYECIEAFLDKNVNRRSEMIALKKFFRIMFLFLINYLTLLTDKKDTKEKRENILKNFIDFKNDEEVDKILFDAIVKNKKVLDKDRTLKSVLNSTHLDIDFDKKNRAAFVRSKKTKLNKKGKIDKLKKKKDLAKNDIKDYEIDEEAVLNWDFDDKKNCECSYHNKTYKNSDVFNLIELFMKQIKNMLFLNLKDKILEYYDELRKIMVEKNFDFEKFVYLPLLFNFQEENEKSAYFNKKKFFNLMDEICSKKICIHDFEIIFLFMEAFQNVNYIESLIEYIHKRQSNAAKKIYDQFLMENFNTKYKAITLELITNIENEKFYLVENSPLIHHFEAEKILKIEKKSSFSFFQRFRYYSIIKKENFELFNNYFTDDQFLKFRIRFILYNTLVNLIRKDLDPLKIINELSDQIISLFEHNDYSHFEEDLFILDMLSIFNLIKFDDKRIELAEKIINIVTFLKSRISEVLFCNLAFMSSHIGNIFYKNGLYKYVKIIKMISLDLKKQSKYEINFSDCWKNEILREIDYDNFSFLFMYSFILNRKAENKIFYANLEEIEPKNELYKVEKLFLKLQNFIYKKDKEAFDNEIGGVMDGINDLEGFPRMFYQAVIDKMLVDTSQELTDKEINNRRRQSRNSMQKVYEDLDVFR